MAGPRSASRTSDDGYDLGSGVWLCRAGVQQRPTHTLKGIPGDISPSLGPGRPYSSGERQGVVEKCLFGAPTSPGTFPREDVLSC